MKRIFAIAMLGVVLAGAHSSIAADSPSKSSCSLSAACPAGSQACDPSNCPMPSIGTAAVGVETIDMIPARRR